MSRAKFVAILVLTLLCAGVTAALAQAGVTVDIVDSDYRPGSATIGSGETVTWTHSGDQPHTVTADDGTFDSGELAPGDTFSMRFDSPGTYRYYCTFHGGPGGQGMSAVVVVEGAAASDDPPSADPGDGDDGVDGDDGDDAAPADETAVPTSEKGSSLPRTGDGPPPVWVFALALGISGLVLWRVARLTETAEHL